VITAGVTDPDMLEHLSRLCGQVSYRQHQADESWQFTEIMSTAMIRQMPDGWALVVRTNCAPVLVRLARGWEQRAYRTLYRHREHIALIDAPAIAAASQHSTIDGSGLLLGELAELADALPAARPDGTGTKNGSHPWSAR
jgi:hypothetical protein